MAKYKLISTTHYKYLQRFFRYYKLGYAGLGQAVVSLIAMPEPWSLSVDRTKWQSGDCAVVHKRVAFAWVWCLLDKQGNSNDHEWAQLLKQFLEHFRNRKIACLAATREFGWFEYRLTDPLTRFRVRIRDNYKLSDGRLDLKVKVLFTELAVEQTQILRYKQQLWGHWLYNAALRLEDGFLLVVATHSAPESPVSEYAKRWSNDMLFSIFKTREFCLKSTHLTKFRTLEQTFWHYSHWHCPGSS